MLIAMDFSVVDVQRRLGHRKPDITLRIYAHEWKYRDAQRSQIGQQIDQVFRADAQEALTAAETKEMPRALPPAPSRAVARRKRQLS